jgi:hypothetical protein
VTINVRGDRRRDVQQVRLRRLTVERLARCGTYGESLDEVLNRLLDRASVRRFKVKKARS